MREATIIASQTAAVEANSLKPVPTEIVGIDQSWSYRQSMKGAVLHPVFNRIGRTYLTSIQF
jgi:hypothetical protein